MTDLPTTIIGGYLGAGKTTLVNHLLRHAGGRKLAILVNEFGALPIDEDLIEAQDDDMIAISGGCICCSFGSDLTEALIKLANLTPKPDHVIIESSGVAMPGAIASSLLILDGFTTAGIVVLADSMTVKTQAADEYIGDTILRQLSDAQIIVQTKSDLVTSQAATECLDWITSINTTAAVIPSDFGRVDVDTILGAQHNAISAPTFHHADADYRSVTFPTHLCPDVTALAQQLTNPELGLVRAKGFVSDTTGTTYLIQIVGQTQTITQTPHDGTCSMVCIGHVQHINMDKLNTLFAATAR